MFVLVKMVLKEINNVRSLIDSSFYKIRIVVIIAIIFIIVVCQTQECVSSVISFKQIYTDNY